MLATILMNTAKALDERKYSRTRVRAFSLNIENLLRVLFQLGGFSFLTIAGFQLNSLTGYAVAGISSLILSWTFTSANSNENQRQ